MAKSSRQTSGSQANQDNNTYHTTPASTTKSSPRQTSAAATSPISKMMSRASAGAPPRPSNTPSKRSTTTSRATAKIHTKNTTLADVDSSNLETSSPSNTAAKIFSINTGLPDSQPTIVLTSEFMPVYDGNDKTMQGKMLHLKEVGSSVTAKVATNLLAQSDDVKTVIQDNKNELLSYASEEKNFLRNLTITVNDAVNTLDVTTFALPNIVGHDTVGSLYEILRKGGYGSDMITDFSETKVWQQSLVELKRTLLTHSPDLTAQQYIRKKSTEGTDRDPYLLSDVVKQPEDMIRLWINPFYNGLPLFSNMSISQQIDANLNSLIDFGKNQYVNLAAANTSQRSTSNRGPSSPALGVKSISRSPDVLMPFEDAGRDISILANVLIKEAFYSSYLLAKENASYLSTRYGFSVNSTSGDNFSVWDYLIGKFSKSVLEFPKMPTGQGRSLVSFSQESVGAGNDLYNVLTFERNFIENSSVTPGSYYYIDSALNTTDGKSFDSARLDSLITKTIDAQQTAKTLFDILGYDIKSANVTIEGVNERYERQDTTPELSLEGITNSLNMVTTMYSNFLGVQPDGGVYSKAKTPSFASPDTDEISTRLAATICKAAIRPDIPYKSLGEKLKSQLFLLFINGVLQKVDGAKNQQTIVEITARINKLLLSVDSKYDNDNIGDAFDEGRIYSLYQVPETDSGNINLQSIMPLKIDMTSGLWASILDLMTGIYQHTAIYTGDSTGYSGLSKVAYLYSYFDLIMRVIAVQTPENLIGTYTRKQDVYSGSGDFATYQGTKTAEVGLVLDGYDSVVASDYFAVYDVPGGESKQVYAKKIYDALHFLDAEDTITVRKLSIFRKYLSVLGDRLTSLKTYLTQNFVSHISSTQSLLAQDSSLNDDQRSFLLNLSFTEEQTRMSTYVLSEMLDRVAEGKDTTSKLSALPMFVDFPDNFVDYLSVNETDHVSFTMLAPYFNSPEFMKKKGNNKKIMSIGIPPKLNRSIRSMPRTSIKNSTGLMQNLVRIKVYKLDRLHPDVVFHPKEFLFEMCRFPTRILSNWDFNSFFQDNVNILTIPTKMVYPDGHVAIDKNFSEAFGREYYGNFLDGKSEEKFQVYSNHVTSFLLEEYLRWFTECRFEDSRYHNYAALSPIMESMEQQFQKYLDFVKATGSPSATVDSISQNSNGQSGNQSQFVDPQSGQAYSMPGPGNSMNGQPGKSGKTHVVPVNDTVKMFFRNETLLSNLDEFKKRIVYPKKFDRVFNVIIDPDDFYVDTSMTSTLDSLVKAKIIIAEQNQNNASETVYRHRDTTPEDVSLDEYFVTVEPYDYVQQYTT